MRRFQGFPEELTDFFFTLPFGNTRERQAENAAAYKRLALPPLEALYEALLPTVMALSPRLDTGKRRCIASPYNDLRFSADRPVKEYVYLRFKLLCGRDTDIPGLYFDLGAEGYSYGLRFYRQTPKGAEALRERAAAAPEAFSAALESAFSAGLLLLGERYKRRRRPELSDSPAGELVNCKRVSVAVWRDTDRRAHAPALENELRAGFTALGPLLALLDEGSAAEANVGGAYGCRRFET